MNSAPALRWRGATMTHADLAALTADARAGLVASGAPPGPVAVCGDKSPHAIAAVLACEDQRRPVLLPPANLGTAARDSLIQRCGCRCVATVSESGIEWQGTDWQGTEASRSPVPPGTRFVLATSGSTGEPKLVPLTADAVDRFMDWATTAFDLGPGVNVLNYAPLNFDLCLLDVWATLRAGGEVTLVDPELAARPRYLRDLFDAVDVHVVQGVPMLFRLLARASVDAPPLAGVRHVLLTGEHTPRPLRAALPALFPTAAFHNVYGCTETNDSFIASFDAATAAVDETLSLGRPLPGVATRVMAGDEPLAGPGTGELWVSTPFQTPGYLYGGADRFVASTVDGVTRRYFRTGDVVARNGEGVLTLVGRTDFQVKVRGVRVNLEQVERVIADHAEVAEVAVVAVPDPDAGQRLHAVVHRTSDRLTDLRLRQHCAAWLSRAAIPSTIRLTDAPLPSTSTGKLARNQIREDIAKGTL